MNKQDFALASGLLLAAVLIGACMQRTENDKVADAHDAAVFRELGAVEEEGARKRADIVKAQTLLEMAGIPCEAGRFVYGSPGRSVFALCGPNYLDGYTIDTDDGSITDYHCGSICGR